MFYLLSTPIFKKVLNKDVDEIWTTEGCEECGNGYSGRIAIQEVLLVNQEIKDAISSSLPKEQLRHLVYSADVTTLLQDGLEKVVEGLTTFEEVLKQIEFENSEEDKGSTYDLNHAIEYTNMSQENDQQEEPISETKVVETKQEKIETPTKEKEVKKDDDWGMDFDTTVEKVENKSVKETKKEPIKNDDFDDDLLNMEF